MMRWASPFRRRSDGSEAPTAPAARTRHRVDLTDPFVAFLLTVDGPVDLAAIDLETPLVQSLRDAGVELAVPIVTGGELVGILSLGPRRSGQPYNTEDRRLLQRLATRAAPALRLAEVMRVQATEVREHERIAQELRVARLIQQNFLPTQLPKVEGWKIGTFYQPAREVGGDFYDFIPLNDGKVGFVIGDVTDKGVPAALVMATTRSLLREAAQQMSEPAYVLEKVNGSLVSDIPRNMFVTCQYATFDAASGKLTMANAGHNLPYMSAAAGVSEIRATGLPLGLMERVAYDQVDIEVALGSSLLFHSDGLAEARNTDGEMFGFPRLMGLIGKHHGGEGLIDHLLSELAAFAGQSSDVEDDVTLVSFERTGEEARSIDARTRILADFTIPSEEGNERLAMQQVVAAISDFELAQPRVEKLKTAVAEATMNAIEHGNQFRADAPVEVRVLATAGSVIVQISDRGGALELAAAATPDLEAKLAGEQSPRGWGLFLIENMVDDLRVEAIGERRTVSLVLDIKRSDP